MIKSWKEFNEDVYYGRDNVYETDEEFENRMTIWLEYFIHEQMGLDSAQISSLTDDEIRISYVKERRWENRPEPRTRIGRNTSREDVIKADIEEWKEMAEDLIDKLTYHDNYHDGTYLGLELNSDDYYTYVDKNGFTIRFEKPLPRLLTGTRGRSVIDVPFEPSQRYESEMEKIQKLKARMEAEQKRAEENRRKNNIRRT